MPKDPWLDGKPADVDVGISKVSSADMEIPLELNIRGNNESYVVQISWRIDIASSCAPSSERNYFHY